MNSTRLAVIGFIVAAIVAVYAFITQGQAVGAAQLAAAQATAAEDERVTAVAMMQEAISTQVQAEAGQATALAAVAIASTAQSESEAAAASALAAADTAATRSAQIAATSTAGSEAQATTAAEEAAVMATAQALSTSVLATAQTELDAQATVQVDTANQLATATAQVDLADFARQSAEDDRATALEQLWLMGTQQAETARELATAQAIISGVPPTAVPTEAPAATPTLRPEATTVTNTNNPGEMPPLTNNFESNDQLVRVQYPQGWFAREVDVDFISIVNDDVLFDRGNSPLQTGQYEIDILASKKETLGVDPAASPEEIIVTFVEFFQSRDDAFQVGDPTALTLGANQASRVIGTDGSNDLTITLLDTGSDGVALVFAYGAAGEGAQYAELLDSVLATVEYS